MDEKNRVIRIITWIAGVMSVAIVLIFPLGYFALTYQRVVGSLEAEAEINGRIISGLVNSNPEMWIYEQERLQELVARRPWGGQKEARRITDIRGRVIAESEDTIAPPLIKRSYDLKDSGVTVGSVEISRSLYPLITATALVALVGISIGLMIFFPLRILPIRALMRAEEALRAAQEELVRKEKLAMLGRIAGNMGNELLNPLGVMNNAVFYLGSALPGADETVREYLGIIESEIDNSRRIISDLLDFTHATPPRRKEVSLRELMDESIGRCAIPENVAVTVELPETLLPVMVAPPQMVQVFQNLIANAVQAMPGGGALHVAARRILNSELRIMNLNSTFNIQNSEFDGDFIEISVADTGEGISPENLERLFQPLFTTRSRGIGLGLAFSRKLAEANGGRIGVESRLGEGTTFRVMLPVGS